MLTTNDVSFSKRFKKALTYSTLATGLLVGLSAPVPTHADTTGSTSVATFTIIPGPLTLSANQSSTTINASKRLDGNGDSDDATSAPAGILNLNDTRGTGAGYTITATAAPLTNGTHTLAGSNLSLNNVTVTKLITTSGTVTTRTVSNTTTIDNGISNTIVGQKSDTTNGDGMGSYQINLNKLNFAGAIPANSYQSTYSTTVTYTIANGPENE